MKKKSMNSMDFVVGSNFMSEELEQKVERLEKEGLEVSKYFKNVKTI